jgi:flagella basal body P-ring formation protein FlgA
MLQVAVALGSAGVATTPSPAVEARIRDVLAVRAGVHADAVQLDWGRLPVLPIDTVGLTLRVGPVSADGWQLATLIPTAGSPVSVRVRSGRSQVRPVATRPLAAGSVIGPADVAWRPGIVWGSESLMQPGSLEGWQVRRSIGEGEAVIPRLVQPPVLIHAGDSVTFVWQHCDVRLERVAMAASSARLGEQVHGRLGTGRLIGRVVGEGQAILEGAP